MGNKIRYGVLGASRIGRNRHVPAAAESEIAEIVAVASRNADTANAWAAETGVKKAFYSYEQMLDDRDIDAVINTLPNSMHAEWTIKALQSGKHVLCEKPLGMNGPEVEKMFAIAESASLQLMEGFITRFHPQLETIREIINSGEIGQVNMMSAELSYPLEDWENDSRAIAALGGGALMDAGCYCANIIRWAIGAEPVSAAATQTLHPVNKVDSSFIGLLKFAGGTIAQLSTSMDQPFRVWCEITGSKGRVHVSNLFANSTITVNAAGKETRKIEVTPGNLFRQQLDNFTNSIKGKEHPRISKTESIGNAATLAALKEAAKIPR